MAINKNDYLDANGDYELKKALIDELIDEANTEYDSNENGDYIQFPNGVQICWINTTRTDVAVDNVYGSLFTGNWTWTFPQPFIARPTVPSPTMRWGNSASWGTAGLPSNNGVGLFILDPIARSAGTNVVIGAIAIGRWK